VLRNRPPAGCPALAAVFNPGPIAIEKGDRILAGDGNTA
jgi:hypothetical protein